MSKTKLFKAATDWDLNTLKQLLDGDSSLINARDAKGRTAFHLCCGKSLQTAKKSVAESIKTMEELVKRGLDINVIHEIPDDSEIFPATPLWYAVARGSNIALARALLQRGADPNHCLFAAIWANHLKMTAMLLDAGANTEEGFAGETPIIYAARLGRVKILKALLAAGANRQFRDSKGKTALDYAKKKKLSSSVLNLL